TFTLPRPRRLEARRLVGPNGGLTSGRVDTGDENGAHDAREGVMLGVFVAYLVVAFVVLVSGGLGHRWFFRDDYFFLVDRKVGSLHDLFADHNEHWSTVPVLAFRALWARVVMRRSGVSSGLATVAAATFVLFGPGSVNIQWAFQIGFVAALDFGLAQL